MTSRKGYLVRVKPDPLGREDQLMVMLYIKRYLETEN